MKFTNNKSLKAALWIAVVFSLLGIFPSTVPAESVTDNNGISWTATRERNTGSGGWDIKVSNNASPPEEFWVTNDAVGDQDPYYQLNPVTDTLWVIWSHQAMGGYRIYYSYYSGSSFTTPAAITSGTGFGDSQPHFQFEDGGEIHLVFFRDFTSSTDKAFYSKYTSSWSAAVQYSTAGDEVSGSTFVSIADDEPDDLEASYLHGTGPSQRVRCKGGDGNPWMDCSQ